METVIDVQLILSCTVNLHCVLLLMYSFLCCVCKLVLVLLSTCSLVSPLCVFASLDSCVMTVGQHKHARNVIIARNYIMETLSDGALSLNKCILICCQDV